MNARTGQRGQDSQNRTAEQDGQKMAAMIASPKQPEQDSENETTRT
jgi:hypothetical protein